MPLQTEQYIEQRARLPVTGKHIIGQFDEEKIIVYQAYNHVIADFAVKNKYLGGSSYSYTRMTWIKPNFLWMMFRAGWATKENQERILAISLGRIQFESILASAVHTTFKRGIYPDEDAWKQAMARSEVRIQWDPDHNPSGHAIERRAIQLGLKGATAEKYAKEWIIDIEDITEFVHQQKKELDANGSASLVVPKEEIYALQQLELAQRIGLEAP